MSPGRAAWLGFYILVLLASPRPGQADDAVVVLLFDGFAPSMVEAFDTPHLDSLRTGGTWTHHLVPAFPSVSLPNQVTISTGCWPERHGVVSNRFRDPDRGRFDHDSDADWLNDCEHLHEVAERQGVRAAALGWVGGMSARRGKLATFVPERDIDDFPDDDVRTQQVVDLIQDTTARRPGLILGYFVDPDKTAHYAGLESKRTRAAVEAADARIGRVVAAIESQSRDMTLLIVTDHGMLPIKTVINLGKIMRLHGIEAESISSGTSAFLYLENPARADEAYAALSGYDEFDVYRPTEPAPGWRLGRSARLGDLIVSAQPPYFAEDTGSWPWWARPLAIFGPKFIPAGLVLGASHGYPPEVEGMHGVFYAWGPRIARGKRLDRFEVVDVHPTVAYLLGLVGGAPMDGKVDKRPILH